MLTIHVDQHNLANPLELFTDGHNDYVATLNEHGAILFRGPKITEADQFAAFGQHLVTRWMDYRDRASKRSAVAGPILTSTDTPPSYPIALHSESSFTAEWPQKVLFCCRVPPTSAGRTPLADTRRIYADLDPDLRQKFERLGVMYYRNFSPGIGMDWRDVFQQKDATAVDEYCRSAKIQTEWVSDTHLRTVQVRPAASKHPNTQEWVWFNHALALSQYALDPTLRATLLRQVGEEGLPHNTYFGNGEPISQEEFDLIRQAHERNTVLFEWQTGDVLLLDNMLMAHGREPYSGDREILAALADPLTWPEIGQYIHLPNNQPRFHRSRILQPSLPVESLSGQADFSGWLIDILRHELGLEVQDLSNGFLDAGGDSVTAVELLDRTMSEFGLEFSIDDFLDAPSMADFARNYSAKLGLATSV